MKSSQTGLSLTVMFVCREWWQELQPEFLELLQVSFRRKELILLRHYCKVKIIIKIVTVVSLRHSVFNISLDLCIFSLAPCKALRDEQCVDHYLQLLNTQHKKSTYMFSKWLAMGLGACFPHWCVWAGVTHLKASRLRCWKCYQAEFKYVF